MKYQIPLLLFICTIMLFIVYYFSLPTPCTVLERIPYKDGTTIHIVNDTCSEGLPHTSNTNTIIMPLSSWNHERREDTLRHELVHIRQRRDSELWYEFYRTHWDYVPTSLPPELSSGLIRPNPDTEDKPFMLWRGQWIFIPIYSQDRSLRKATVRVYDIQTKSFTSIPPEWTAFFSTGLHQYEHPNEISAEFLTTRRECTASLKLYEFFKKHYD